MDINIVDVIKKIKPGIVKVLNKFWQNLYLLMILLLVLDLVLGGIFFSKYYLRKEEKPQKYISIKINENLIEEFSLEYQNREKIFKEIEKKEYLDPFQGIIPEEID